MAGIGDYIHFHHTTYRLYGTQQKIGAPIRTGEVSFQGAYQLMRQQKKATVKNAFSIRGVDTIPLEQHLNEIVYPKQNVPRFGDKEKEAAFIKMVNDAFHERFADFDIDWKHGLTVHANKNIFKKGQERKKVGVVKQYADIIEAKAKEMQENGNVNNSQVQEFLQLVTDIRKITDEIADDNSYINFATNTELKNRIISALNSGQLPYAGAIGEAFEDVLAFASMFGNEVTGKTIKDSLVGLTGKSSVKIDTKFFDKNFVNFDVLKTAFKGYKINENTSIEFESHNETQNKVDVIFDFQGQTYNISAKNYSLKGAQDAIHILSGASMLSLIQDENPNFINHWLNIATPNENNTNDLGNLFMAAHQAMYTVILTKAFTGSVYGRSGAADTFVLNHRTKKHVYVFSMHNIISKLVQTLGNATSLSSMNTVVEIGNYPSSLDNIWKGIKDDPDQAQADVRIAGLLAQLHAAKLKVAIPQTSIVRLQK